AANPRMDTRTGGGRPPVADPGAPLRRSRDQAWMVGEAVRAAPPHARAYVPRPGARRRAARPADRRARPASQAPVRGSPRRACPPLVPPPRACYGRGRGRRRFEARGDGVAARKTMSSATFPVTYFPPATQRQFAKNRERIRGKPYERY